LLLLLQTQLKTSLFAETPHYWCDLQRLTTSAAHLKRRLLLLLPQEGDLKYMVAFGSARSALEWCLLVQEAALYLNWPDKRCGGAYL
jgi:hypothetical protein